MIIKNLIFDLGNVLYLLDENKFVNCFKKHSIDVLEGFYSEKSKNIHFDYEKGLISTLDFFEKFSNTFSKEIGFDDFVKCWNSLLVGFYEQNINLVNELAKKYNTVILSNINDLHYLAIKDELHRLAVRKMYFSHFIHCRKPEKRCFELVLKENNFSARQTLFIDDNNLNISAAEHLNIKTLLVENPFSLKEALNKFL